MNEEVAGAAVSMTEKAIAGTIDISVKTMEALISLMRLLHAINEESQKRAERKLAEKQKGVVQTDLLQKLKMRGQVPLPELREYAAKNNEQIIYSEQPLTKADVAQLTKDVKEIGIPISFLHQKDKKTYYPVVCASDAEAFKLTVSGVISEKLNEDRQKPAHEREYAQLAVAKWELPFISEECRRLDIQGCFAPHPTEKNQIIFVYRRQDEQAALSITDLIEKKCKEMEEVRIQPDNENYVTVTDNISGRVYSFDLSNTSEEVLIDELQDKLGFDSMKARLTAAKFENNCLTQSQIEQFKQNEPQNAFYSFGELYIPDPKTGKESNVTAPYKMGYYASKYENQPCFSISTPQGESVIFTAREITPSTVHKKLEQELGVTDKKLLDALTQKVDQCSRFMAKNNMSTVVTFSKADFDMSNPVTASGMKRTDATGIVLVKKQPIDSLSLKITRTGKNSFAVTSTAEATEYDESGNGRLALYTREIQLTLHDPKKAYNSIREALVSQGVPLKTAKNIAHETVQKAQSQPEKEIVYMDRLASSSVICFTASREAAIPVKNGYVKAEDLQEAFGISPDEAKQAASNIHEQVRVDVQQRVAAVQKSRTDFHAAMNRLTEQKQIRQSTPVVCSVADPQKHLIVAGLHDGRNAIYELSVYQGSDKVARFSHKETGSDWSDLQNTIMVEMGIRENTDILVFDTPEDYQQYLDDTALLEQSADSTELAFSEDAAELQTDTGQQLPELNGHEQHPEGNLLMKDGIKGDGPDPEALSDALESMTDDDVPSIGARR